MSKTTGPFDPSAVAGLATLRKVLDEAGYLVKRLGECGVIPSNSGVLSKAAIHDRLKGQGKFETLARLLAMGDAIPKQEADEALAPLGTEPLIACGLLKKTGANVQSEAAMVPVAHLLMMRDLHANMTGGKIRDDHVLGVGLASLVVNELTPRMKIGKALDIGTGQGIQALGAATHAANVVATDVNARALNFAAMNAALAGTANVDFRLGSFLEPVKGEEGTFDLIVSNPPFVIRPPDNVVGFSAGLSGDQAVEHLVRECPKYLAEGGFCTLSGNWYHSDVNDWTARPKAWLEGSGCDAWLIRFQNKSPQEYARHWIREVTESDEFDAPEVARWMAYYDTLGIGAITFGAVVLRKRTGNNWVREDTIPRELRRGDAGFQVQQIFNNETLVRTHRPEELLKMKFRAAPGLETSRAQHLGREGWQTVRFEMAHRQGFVMPLAIDEALAGLIEGCTGAKSVTEVVGQIATKAGISTGFAMKHAAGVIVPLLRTGYLIE